MKQNLAEALLATPGPALPASRELSSVHQCRVVAGRRGQGSAGIYLTADSPPQRSQ